MQQVPIDMIAVDVATQAELDTAIADAAANLASHIVDAAHLSSTLDLSAKTLTLPAAYTPVFTKSYESAQQVITAGGLLTLAHSLGVAPKLVQAELVCVTGELNWVAGDRMVIAITAGTDSALNRGMAVSHDATNVYVRFGTAPAPFVINNKNSGATAAATAANWKLVIRAIA